MTKWKIPTSTKVSEALGDGRLGGQGSPPPTETNVGDAGSESVVGTLVKQSSFDYAIGNAPLPAVEDVLIKLIVAPGRWRFHGEATLTGESRHQYTSAQFVCGANPNDLGSRFGGGVAKGSSVDPNPIYCGLEAKSASQMTVFLKVVRIGQLGGTLENVVLRGTRW